MTGIREKQKYYGDMTTQSESNFEYIREYKPNDLSSMDNVFSAIC